MIPLPADYDAIEAHRFRKWFLMTEAIWNQQKTNLPELADCIQNKDIWYWAVRYAFRAGMSPFKAVDFLSVSMVPF